MSSRSLYALVPVYNEGRSIYDLLAGFQEALVPAKISGTVIVIDDCSTDDSASWIENAVREFSSLDIQTVRHERNLGLHGALNTGLDRLRAIEHDDILVTLDGDNTHDPRLIPVMIAAIDAGSDIVIASRYCAGSRVVGVSRFRLFLSWGARWLYWGRWHIPGVRDYTSLFRVYKGSVVGSFLDRATPPYLHEQGFTVTTELLRKLALSGPTISEVAMTLRYDQKANLSNMRVGRTVWQTLVMLVRR